MNKGVLTVFFGLCVFLIVVNLFALELFSTTDDPVSFSAILGKLDNAPTINLSLDQSVQMFQITEEWSILDGLRTFINYLGYALGLIVYLCTLAINLAIFVSYAFYLLGLSSFSNFV